MYDVHGQAALLLCESLMHVLIEQGIITKETALSAVNTVVEVTQDRSDKCAASVMTLAEAIERSLDQI